MSGQTNATGMQGDRRHPALARVPFEALVEIAAPEGTSFEAESVDLSSTGMHLKTGYLPKVGTQLTFRFEPGGDGAPVLCKGEVVWAEQGYDGCEFGVRFGDVRPEGAAAIRTIVGLAPASRAGGDAAPVYARTGAPVRIHIAGVSAPMKATVRDDASKGAIVGSELKMLRIGAMVELEDKERGMRRAARVDDVDCEVDPASHVPQLVVRLRYESETSSSSPCDNTPVGSLEQAYDEPRDQNDAPGARDVVYARDRRDETTAPASHDLPSAPAQVLRARGVAAADQPREALPVARERGRFGAVADGMRSVGTAMRTALVGAGGGAVRLGARARATIALVSRRDDKTQPLDAEDGRRTTASLPAGGAGKARTLRPQAASRGDYPMGDGNEEGAMQEMDSLSMKKATRRKQIGIAAAVSVAAVLGFLAFRKPQPAPPAVTQAPAAELAPASAAPIAPVVTPPPPLTEATPATVAPAPLVGDSTGSDAKGNPHPFGTPTVKHGTRMVLRLDGPVTELRGMQMPNGFVVSVPNRKSLEAAGPLVSKDSRISSAKVVNQPGGAELTIAFKESAPAFVVKAKGDALEIVLAHDKAVAKKAKGKAAASAPKLHAKKK